MWGQWAGWLHTRDTVARLGGDEFAMIVELSDEADSLSVICRKIQDTLEQPYRIRGQEIVITCSIGCARYPEQTGDAAELVRMADEAMYGVKHNGKGFWQQFQA